MLSVKNKSHNHEPTLADIHLSHRQNVLTTVVREEIINLNRSKCTPTQIITKLRLNEDLECLLIKSHDIYNIKSTARVKALRSLTLTQAILVLLHTRDN